jgi:hypothetical protein
MLLAVRVDADTVASDGLGDIGVHLAVYPGGNRPGPVADFNAFVDLGIGGALSTSSGAPRSTGVAGVGRVGVAWERFRQGRIAFGPFLAGEAARGSGQVQAAALVGLSVSLLSTGK